MLGETGKNKKWWFLGLAVIGLDQISKTLILKYFPQLVIINKGIAFGFLASDWWLLINLFILGLVVFFLKNKPAKSLIIAGGVSNILDRLFRGGVVDFINIGFFPSFNLADFFICLGAGLVVLSYLKRGRVSNKKIICF